MSRPTTASRPSTASRPGTASASRPGTASGRRHLGSSSVDYSTPVLQSTKNNDITQEIISRELDGDNLLRIMNFNKIQLENEALIICTDVGDVEKLRHLINHGLNVSECRGLNGYTLLHHAATKGHNAIIAELLKHQRIDVDVKNNIGETPLHLAVYAGHILTVDQLLDFGADINATNDDSETCLFYAARKSFSPIIRLLVQRGINVNLKDRFDECAVDQITNPLSMKAFEVSVNKQFERMEVWKGRERFTSDDLLLIFSYLDINQVLKSACVSTKWHRISENPILWKSLGIRKWEFALQNSLGFGMTKASSFLKPPSSKIRRSNSSSTTLAQPSLNRMRSNSNSGLEYKNEYKSEYKSEHK